MIDALIKEAKAEQGFFGDEQVSTIYFGGGTPSLLDVGEIESLVSTLHQHYRISADVEVTLEANPDNINNEALREWKTIGINRLSLGVQSFYENELVWMNRAHNASQAYDSVEMALVQFPNLTVDLIYGSPLLTDEMWSSNVQQAISLGVPHLSCYALTVEDQTPLSKSIELQKTVSVDSDQQAAQFLLLMTWLKEAGYEHYEVSNFAKPGFQSRHNSSYWKGEKYLGLGPSAHSYDGVMRRWNIANNARYVKGINEGTPDREVEVLTTVQKLNEYVMVSLRTTEGINLKKVEHCWGITESQRILTALKKSQHEGLITLFATTATLTHRGMLFADGIAADLFATGLPTRHPDGM